MIIRFEKIEEGVVALLQQPAIQVARCQHLFFYYPKLLHPEILHISLYFCFEQKKIISGIQSNKNLFFKYLFLMSISLFLGTYLQQTSLLYTNIANAAFFTVFYVPLVPLILFI